MAGINTLLAQSFTHMTGSELDAKAVVEKYKEQYTIKKSTINKKTKKGNEYWIVKVDVAHLEEKEAFDIYFDVE